MDSDTTVKICENWLRYCKFKKPKDKKYVNTLLSYKIPYFHLT